MLKLSSAGKESAAASSDSIFFPQLLSWENFFEEKTSGLAV